MQAYVKSLAGKLELHFLQPYAPDLNPDEFVWGYAKDQRSKQEAQEAFAAERILDRTGNVRPGGHQARQEADKIILLRQECSLC